MSLPRSAEGPQFLATALQQIDVDAFIAVMDGYKLPLSPTVDLVQPKHRSHTAVGANRFMFDAGASCRAFDFSQGHKFTLNPSLGFPSAGCIRRGTLRVTRFRVRRSRVAHQGVSGIKTPRLHNFLSGKISASALASFSASQNLWDRIQRLKNVQESFSELS